MYNAQEVHDADQNDRFREELKSQRIASANSVSALQRRTGRTPNRPLRFSDLDRELRQVKELSAPRDSWLGLEP